MAARDLSNVKQDVYDYLSRAAYETGYPKKSLMQAAAMESTMGLDDKAFKDPSSTYYGVMQSSKMEKELSRIYSSRRSSTGEFEDPTMDRAGDNGMKAAYYYGAVVKDRVRNTSKWKDYDFDFLAKDLGIDDPQLLEYMTWQQGREGTMQILSVLDESSSGEFILDEDGENPRRDKLIDNISTKGREELSSYDDRKLARIWLQDTKERWEDYGREVMQLGKNLQMDYWNR